MEKIKVTLDTKKIERRVVLLSCNTRTIVAPGCSTSKEIQLYGKRTFLLGYAHCGCALLVDEKCQSLSIDVSNLIKIYDESLEKRWITFGENYFPGIKAILFFCDAKDFRPPPTNKDEITTCIVPRPTQPFEKIDTCHGPETTKRFDPSSSDDGQDDPPAPPTSSAVTPFEPFAAPPS